MVSWIIPIVRQSKTDFIHRQVMRPVRYGGSHFVKWFSDPLVDIASSLRTPIDLASTHAYLVSPPVDLLSTLRTYMISPLRANSLLRTNSSHAHIVPPWWTYCLLCQHSFPSVHIVSLLWTKYLPRGSIVSPVDLVSPTMDLISPLRTQYLPSVSPWI